MWKEKSWNRWHTGFIGPTHIEAIRRLGFVEVIALNQQLTKALQAKMLNMKIEGPDETVVQIECAPALYEGTERNGINHPISSEF